jgi:hypothetical protein
MQEKKKIRAVFKEELQNLLLSLNEIEPINNGERMCIVCSKVITLENIQLLIPRSGNSIEYVCDSPTCVEAYNRKKETKP